MAELGPRESLVGRRLGEFVVREELSQGGFGTVFRAEQPALAREAVIKVPHTGLRASEMMIQRFLREARLASRLDHPYAAHIYAFGAEPDGVLWIAMELVRGTPLDKLIESKGPVALERFVPLIERICQVVQTAHEQGIVHRDIKPGNVMVLVRAGQLLPKLLDLGIAKLDEEEPPITSTGERLAIEQATVAASAEALAGTDAFAQTIAPSPSSIPPATGASTTSGRLTEDGAVMGSPLYMAPEQWTDAGTADARSDIYALGVLSYEALTGMPPFAGANRFAIAMAHAQTPTPPLGEGFPIALDAVLAKAMAKRPDQRYASAVELANAFKQASGFADEAVALPRLPEGVRGSVVASAPQPLAHAVAALEATRNAHQARDAVWQLARVAARLIGVTALAAHAHVGDGGAISETSITTSLRRLRNRAMPDAEWLALARELAAPFKAMRDAYPLPELLDFFAGGDDALSELIAMRDAADGGASDEQVRELLATAMPIVEKLLGSLEFFSEYRLVVPAERSAELWMGVRRTEPARILMRGTKLPPGEPALVTADGIPVVSLFPFLQYAQPGPGVAHQLFFFEGKGRRGARLVALPESYELEDEELWNVVGGMVREAADATTSDAKDDRSPFPGLAPFTAGDSSRFFGRERETEGFVNRLRTQPLLAVVGPSGAGKSSFVQAGVVPNLPEGWQVVTLRPGAAPLVSLTARLAQVGFDPALLRSEIAEHASGLGTMLRTRTTSGVLVLVIDQLEELFTLCEDVKERELFAEVIVRSARSADDPIRVVFTLRDDFLLAAEALPALRARLAPALHLLTTPGREDLLRILTEPLRLAGYELDDPALAGDMVDALAGTRSALALLSFTASKLWDLRDRRFHQISRKAYTSLGGVGGALAQHAETALAAMLPEEQRLAREVFRHAVTSEGTRAVLSRAEIEQILGGGVHAKAVVEKLVSARLLVIAEAAGGGEQIEITHEALVDAWPRLVTWRREDAEGARLRDQLRAAARQWEERGKPTGLLWRGDALAEYRLWRGRYPGSLTDLENAFASASVGDADRTARRRRLTLAAAFAVLAVGTIALFFLNRSANEHRAAAVRSATELRAERRDQAEEQGRTALVDVHDAPLALRYLQQAADLGASGPAHDLLVAFAERVPASKLRTFALPDASNRASFSPDGTRVAAAVDDGTARIFDVQDGTQLISVKQDREIQRVELSADGKRLLTGGFDGVAVLWDAATGRELHRFQVGAAGDNVLCARLSPDGKFVVTANDHDAAQLWDAATGTQLARLTPSGELGDLQVGTPCAFSADGALVAVGDEHGTTRIWHSATASLVATASGHTAQINRLAFSPDGKQLATASSDGKAAIWDVVTGRRVHELSHRGRVWAAAWSSDGKRVATCSDDRTGAVWNAATGARELTLTGHVAGVNDIAFRSDGKQLASISDDGVVYLWDATTGRRESSLQGHAGSIDDVEYDPSGSRLVTAGDDGQVILWSAAPQQPTVDLVGHATTVWALDFSPDGRLLASADHLGTIRIWDIVSGATLRTIETGVATRDVRFNPAGNVLAAGDQSGRVRLWDVATGVSLGDLAGHTDMVRQVAWSPDGTWLATASTDNTVHISPVPSGAPPIILHLPARATGVAWSPAGDRLATATSDGQIREWDPRSPGAAVRTWTYVPKNPTGGKADQIVLETVRYDHDGKRLLGATTNGSTAVVWDLARTPRDGFELRGHHGNIFDTTWSPDGRFVLTGSIDGSAKLWDPATGRDLASFDLEEQQVRSVAWNPDGRSIATGTKDGVILVWTLPVLHTSGPNVH